LGCRERLAVLALIHHQPGVGDQPVDVGGLASRQRAPRDRPHARDNHHRQHRHRRYRVSPNRLGQTPQQARAPRLDQPALQVLP